MIIDFTQPLKDLDGNPVKSEKENEIVILGIPCINALLATPQGDNTKPIEKMDRFLLAQRIRQAKEPVDLTVEEVAKIKDLVGKYMSILIMGSVWQALEEAGK